MNAQHMNELSIADRASMTGYTFIMTTNTARNAVVDALIDLGYVRVYFQNALGRAFEITPAGRDALIASRTMSVLSSEEQAIVSEMAHHTHEWMLCWHNFSATNATIFSLIRQGVLVLESNTPECFFISLANKEVKCFC